ncbi:MAG: hypothetical protein IPK20_16305 [Betaproteobacteria bacterium]|nr:hypothetical protein [Betaproteobacteria bacterium]
MADIVRQAVEHVPPGSRLVIASRSSPSKAFTALLADSRMSLIDWHSLRFTVAETAEFSGLGPITAVQLCDACAGWPAGMRLLLSPGDSRREYANLSDRTSVERLDEYFATEVLDRLTPDQRRVLLRTSVVADVPGSLAIALSGRQEAPRILEALSRGNLFTERHGGVDATYRYHDLFRSFLLKTAENELGGRALRELRAAAAQALEVAGANEAAIDLYLQAEEWLAAGRVVIAESQGLRSQGRTGVLRDWLGRIPRFLVEDPDRCR